MPTAERKNHVAPKLPSFFRSTSFIVLVIFAAAFVVGILGIKAIIVNSPSSFIRAITTRL